MQEAFHLFSRNITDLFDITETGVHIWLSSFTLYEKKLERIEERIIHFMEDRLNNSHTTDEMFRVFAIYNPLFFRPNIRNAVNSFRTTLVKNVREDVTKLQNKFRCRYDESLEKSTAELRDIPPLSGRIIWARQIEHQLAALMKRMEDVLGVGWENIFEGKQLKEICDELKGYLDTDSLYKDWLSTQLKSDSRKYNKTQEFLLIIDEDTITGNKKLKVNFDEKQINLFKEVRYLEWLLPNMSTTHKTLPSTLIQASKDAYAHYPIAIALQAALAGYMQAKNGINKTNYLLLVAQEQAVRDLILEAFGGKY